MTTDSGQTHRRGERVMIDLGPGRANRVSEVLCIILDPGPLPDPEGRDNGRERMRVCCIDEMDPMNGREFVLSAIARDACGEFAEREHDEHRVD